MDLLRAWHPVVNLKSRCTQYDNPSNTKPFNPAESDSRRSQCLRLHSRSQCLTLLSRAISATCKLWVGMMLLFSSSPFLLVTVWPFKYNSKCLIVVLRNYTRWEQLQTNTKLCLMRNLLGLNSSLIETRCGPLLPLHTHTHTHPSICLFHLHTGKK